MKAVKPSIATDSPSRTYSATASLSEAVLSIAGEKHGFAISLESDVEMQNCTVGESEKGSPPTVLDEIQDSIVLLVGTRQVDPSVERLQYAATVDDQVQEAPGRLSRAEVIGALRVCPATSELVAFPQF